MSAKATYTYRALEKYCPKTILAEVFSVCFSIIEENIPTYECTPWCFWVQKMSLSFVPGNIFRPPCKYIHKKTIGPNMHCLRLWEARSFLYLQGVQERLYFFTIHCNPFLSVRDLHSSQRNASVQSLLLAGNFLYNQRGWGGKLLRIHGKKNTIFNEHPV